ncbi:MAG TPA: 1-deoxy-D-xylulose-5-phosphate synthase, partial [Longimicrobiales bacterium]
GSLTSGIAYEGLNNAGNTETDLIVVLNDNEMSISPNVGAIHKYLTRIVTNPAYNAVRDRFKHLIHNRPGALGKAVEGMLLKLEESVKNMLVPGTLFEELGFRYVGPVDGHDLDALVDTFTQVKKWHGPRLVHVRTVKGKGFHLAEANPVVWHGATPFDKLSGQMASKKGLPAYTNVFGRGLAELGARNPKMAVITAAMPSGTGTGVFGDAFPDRFFDVGIAEGHAITFAAGLATEGIKPVAAIYSTFLQRAYDSVVHDVAIQNLPMVLAMDRAGLVGNDGPTHAGLYDIAYLMAIPNVVVTAPKDGAEMLALLRLGVEEVNGPFSLRYPRDNVPEAVPPLEEIPRVAFGTWEVLRRGRDVALLGTGTMVLPALEAAERLAAEGIEASVVNCRFLKPMDAATLEWVVESHDAVVTIEEGTIVNGFGAALAREVEGVHGRRPELRLAAMGVPDRFVDHAGRGEQLEEVGLTPEGIAAQARALVEAPTPVPVRGTA